VHCLSCNCLLNNYESKRKDLNGKFIDLCADCYAQVKNDILSTDDDDIFLLNTDEHYDSD
jgi:hypothetical protein